MSTLKVDGIRNNSATSDAITLASDGTCQAKLVRVGGGGLSGFRNLVINGNMKIHQKTNLALSTTLGYRTADRFYVRATSTSTIFHNSCLNGVLKCYGANAVTAFDTRHGIEWDDEFYGKTMTLSFNATTQSGGVKVAVELVDGAITTTAQDYAHVTGTTVNVYNYTLNSTSGWYGNKYVLTVDIPSDADVSFTPDMLRLRIGNSNSGSSQSFELSNVQLEFGDTPTVFEYEPEHITLDKCLRYLYVIRVNDADVVCSQTAYAKSTTNARGVFFLPKSMRTYPTYTGTATDVQFYAQNSSGYFHYDDILSSLGNVQSVHNNTWAWTVTTTSISGGQGGVLLGRTETGQLEFSAEL